MATKEDVPKVQMLIKPTVLALRRIGGSGTLHEITESVAKEMSLPEEVQEVSKDDTNDTWFGYRCRWARTYLKYMDLVDNSERGVWALTEKGKSASDAEIDAVWSDVKVLLQKRRAEKQQAESLIDEDETEDDKQDQSWEELLLDCLKTMAPDAFERLCQRILRESGFSKVEVTGRSGDGGIDGMGVLRINLISFQTLFQCKRFKDAVGSSVVRDFRGAMIGRADKGLILTTGRFTADAQREATRDGAPAIELIDGMELCILLKDLRLGLSVETVEEITVHRDFFAAI